MDAEYPWRRVQCWRGTHFVAIPARLVRDLGIKKGQYAMFAVAGSKIVFKMSDSRFTTRDTSDAKKTEMPEKKVNVVGFDEAMAEMNAMDPVERNRRLAAIRKKQEKEGLVRPPTMDPDNPDTGDSSEDYMSELEESIGPRKDNRSRLEKLRMK
ncbi:MAG: hypothetical protein MPI95_06800 [Nitrosopumilus sp.]|nr:hypothetical protein [Nitrosopumilus sp.]MDA7958776.1 hypothetical protein [Nitrosopumilus sp.]